MLPRLICDHPVQLLRTMKGVSHDELSGDLTSGEE